MNHYDEILFQDRRCLRLSKAFIFGSETLMQQDKNIRLCFGYFDALEVECLHVEGDENWLETIWIKEIRESRNITSEIYKHPMFVTAQGNLAWKNALDSFWKRQAEYLLVSLVHFAVASSQQENCKFSVRDRFSEVKKKVDDIIKKYGSNVSAVFYHSIDLSDMVIIWKTDRLSDVMKCLKEVYLANTIGNMHTICSFSMNTDVSSENEEEAIDYVSFRFSVKNAYAADRFFSLIAKEKRISTWFNQKPYLSIGSEDIEFVFHNITATNLKNFMYTVFQNSEINSCFKHGFNESLTHIGVALSAGIPEKTTDCFLDNSLAIRCRTVFEYFRKIRAKLIKKETEANYSWLKLVSVQLNTLISMSQLCVLDRFCYLMLDSVQTFLEILGKWISDGIEITSQRLSLIQKYVRSWGILMDQTVRTDGQFTQNIGVSPAFYDIPVSLLEFYIAFTRRCIAFLQKKDNGMPQNYYALFLMPNLCRRTKVQDVFKQNSPPTDRLLYVDIPLDYLYRPRLVIFQLCHEISHYCGETARRREDRKNALSAIFALLTAEVLQINQDDVFHQIQSDLNAKFSNTSFYMQETINGLWTALKKQMSAGTCLKWVDIYIDRQCEGEYVKQNLRYRLLSNIERFTPLLLEQIQTCLEEVVYLFNECYADISMIYLLKPSDKEYIELYQQEIAWLRQDDVSSEAKKRYKRRLLAQRVALVTQIIAEQHIWEDKPTYEASEMTDFMTDVHMIQEHLRERKIFSASDADCIPCGVLLIIKGYLTGAYKGLELQYGKDPGLKEIQTVMETVSRNFSDDSKEYRETIMMYENGLLQKDFWIEKDRNWTDRQLIKEDRKCL